MTIQAGPGPGQPDPALSAVMSERRQLINLTYRLLGSLAEAEDAVQETYARWYAMSGQQQDAIKSPGAWLTTVASRICLNLLGSARARRETYVGEWLPEPLPEPAEWPGGRPGGATADPADRVTLDELVTMAFLVVLETMTPAERVALILTTSSTTPSPKSPASPAAPRRRAASWPPQPAAASAVRTLPRPREPGRPASSGPSKRHGKPRTSTPSSASSTPDATATGDGGGLAVTFLRPIEGDEQIARAWIEIANRASGNMTFLERTVNGQPGLVAQQDGRTVTVFAFQLTGDRIKHIWAVRNPEKLRPWTTG